MIERLFPHGVLHYAGGGALLGLAIGWLFVATGWLGGMSTVYSSTWSWLVRAPAFRDEKLVASRAWRLFYAAGLVLGALAWALAAHAAPSPTAIPAWRLLVGGAVSGFGARLASGCTAGHGICGLASFDRSSLVAVVTFLSTAIVVAQLVAALGGA